MTNCKQGRAALNLLAISDAIAAGGEGTLHSFPSCVCLRLSEVPRLQLEAQSWVTIEGGRQVGLELICVRCAAGLAAAFGLL